MVGKRGGAEEKRKRATVQGEARDSVSYFPSVTQNGGVKMGGLLIGGVWLGVERWSRW